MSGSLVLHEKLISGDAKHHTSQISMKLRTELELGSLVPRATVLLQKLVSTTELRASPGRAQLGFTLKLVKAVCGRGHSIGYREAHRHT